MDKEREIFLQRRQMVYDLYDTICEDLNSIIGRYNGRPKTKSTQQALRGELEQYLNGKQSFSPVGALGVKTMRENIKIDSDFSKFYVDIIDKDIFLKESFPKDKDS